MNFSGYQIVGVTIGLITDSADTVPIFERKT